MLDISLLSGSGMDLMSGYDERVATEKALRLSASEASEVGVDAAP